MGTTICRPRPAHKVQSIPRPPSGCVFKTSDAASDRSSSGCRASSEADGSNTIISAEHNLDLDALCTRLGRFGPLEEQHCYTYVIQTVDLGQNGELIQTASAPNFSGEFITLCTCKRDMRALLTPEQWRKGIWIAGMTGSGKEFGQNQSLVFLMRVGEAYASYFDLVEALRASGRTATLEAKDSTHHPKGDVMIPLTANLTSQQRVAAEFYHPPMLPHAHRHSEGDTRWHEDVNHVDRWGRRPAYLVGDPENSFTWSRQLILNTKPGNLRPYRTWSLGQLVERLAKFPK